MNAAPAKVTALLGPTNTGKTHFAIERMLAHRAGMIACRYACWRARSMSAPCA